MENNPTIPHRMPIGAIPRNIPVPLHATINAFIWDRTGDVIVQMYFLLPRESVPPGLGAWDHFVYMECYLMSAWHSQLHRPGFTWVWA